MILFTKAIDKKLFKNFEKIYNGSHWSDCDAVVKIFNPYGKGTWYIISSDPNDPDYMWGIGIVDEVDVGSISRSELENLRIGKFNFRLEREYSFTPINAEKLYKMLKNDRDKDWEDESEPTKVEPKPAKKDSPTKITLEDVYKATITLGRLRMAKAEDLNLYYPNVNELDENQISEIKRGIQLCLDNDVPVTLITVMASGSEVKIAVPQNNEAGFGNPVFSLQYDYIYPRYVELMKQWKENYYESGFKYLQFPIEKFKSLGYNRKVTKTFEGTHVDGEKYQATFDMWIHDDKTTVVSFQEGRTGDGGYSSFYAEGVDNGFGKVKDLLSIATYVKEVDFYENGYGQVDEKEALQVLSENESKFPTKFDTPAPMSVVRDEDAEEAERKVYDDTTEKLLEMLREQIKNRKYEYKPSPETMTEIRKGIELCQAEAIPIDWISKFVLGTLITTEGESEGKYKPEVYTFKTEFILDAFQKFISKYKANMFVAGWKYPDLDVNALQSLGFKSRGIKEETRYNPYSKKDFVSENEVWITDDFRHIYTIGGAYSGLVSTDVESGYALAVALTDKMTYVKDVDYFMNGLGGMSFDGSLETLQEAMKIRMNEIQEQMSQIKGETYASGGQTKYNSNDIDALIADLNKATNEVRSNAPKFTLDHIDTTINKIDPASKLKKPNKLAKGGSLRSVWDDENNSFIYDERIEILKQAGWITKKGLPDKTAKKSANLDFDSLPSHVKFPLIDQFKKGEIKLAKGDELQDLPNAGINLFKEGGEVNNNFERIYKKYADKNYFGTDDQVEIQINNWKKAKERGQEGIDQYNPKMIEEFVRNAEKMRAFKSYQDMIKAIEEKDAKFLKERIRHDQKFSKELYESITKTKLPSSSKAMHDHIDSYLTKKLAQGDELQDLPNAGINLYEKGGMTYEKWLELSEIYNKPVDELSDKLNAYPKGEMGLVEESVRISPEYKKLKSEYNFYWQRLQQFNSLPESKKFDKLRYENKIKEANKRYKEKNKLAQGDELQDLPNAGINLYEDGGKVEPIRQLGTGSNVYFETEKYRVNERGANKIILLVGDQKSIYPIDEWEFDTPEEAVFVAKRLQEHAPQGLDKNYHNIEAIKNNLIQEYAQSFGDGGDLQGLDIANSDLFAEGGKTLKKHAKNTKEKHPKTGKYVVFSKLKLKNNHKPLLFIVKEGMEKSEAFQLSIALNKLHRGWFRSDAYSKLKKHGIIQPFDSEKPLTETEKNNLNKSQIQIAKDTYNKEVETWHEAGERSAIYYRNIKIRDLYQSK